LFNSKCFAIQSVFSGLVSCTLVTCSIIHPSLLPTHYYQHIRGWFNDHIRILKLFILQL